MKSVIAMWKCGKLLTPPVEKTLKIKRHFQLFSHRFRRPSSFPHFHMACCYYFFICFLKKKNNSILYMLYKEEKKLINTNILKLTG